MEAVSPKDVTVQVQDEAHVEDDPQDNPENWPQNEPLTEQITDAEEMDAWVKQYQGRPMTLETLFPPLKWLPSYIRCVLGKGTEADHASVGALPYSLKGDMIAGLTVGFMLVPQSLAFALLAGLPIQVGLYSSFAPLLVYALFGTIRQVQPGPTALMSLIAGSALDASNYVDPEVRMQAAALLAALVGLISIALGTIRFGFIVDFMSHSVMAAFCSAAGITIATSQLKYMFGIKMERLHYWWETVGYLASHLPETDLPTLAVAWTLLFGLLFLKYWKSAGSLEQRKAHIFWRYFPKDKDSKGFKLLRFMADTSSLFSVIIGWLWGLAYRRAGIDSVQLVGEVEGSGFVFTLPGSGLGDFDLSLLSSAAIAAVVGFLETMAVGGKFAMQARYDYDANQELLALGFMNIMSGVMSGYPTTGSFSRTAVNAMFGATSLMACVTSSILVLLSALFLLPVVEKLPLCSLAPIIIQGAIGVVDLHEFKAAFSASTKEFGVMLVTFLVSLGLTVKEGLLAGFVLSIMKTMYDLSNPNLVVLGRLPDGSFRDIRNFGKEAELLPNSVVVRMDARLSFANARKMREFCLRAAALRQQRGDQVSYLIIDGKSINDVDLTGCQMLELLAETLQTRGCTLVVANLKGPVARCLAKAGVPQALKRHRAILCIDMDRAIQITQGKSDQRNSVDVRKLVERMDEAENVMARVRNPFNMCPAADAEMRQRKGNHPTSPTGPCKDPDEGHGNQSAQEPLQARVLYFPPPAAADEENLHGRTADEAMDGSKSISSTERAVGQQGTSQPKTPLCGMLSSFFNLAHSQ